MATRDIITIDESKCDGCGLCVGACAEGAIQLVDGKAKLVSETYCDGLGACLGSCPQDAIAIERAEARPFDEEAVREHLARLQERASAVRTVDPPEASSDCGCPGARMVQLRRPPSGEPADAAVTAAPTSQLGQWPVQLHLVSPMAPYFQGADLLLAADCVAFAVGDFHQSHLRGKSLAVCCPKLDDGQERYVEKLTSLIEDAKINTMTVMVMEVPCCRGLLRLAQLAWTRAKRRVPVKLVVAGMEGDIQLSEWVSESWSHDAVPVGENPARSEGPPAPSLRVLGNR